MGKSNKDNKQRSEKKKTQKLLTIVLADDSQFDIFVIFACVIVIGTVSSRHFNVLKMKMKIFRFSLNSKTNERSRPLFGWRCVELMAIISFERFLFEKDGENLRMFEKFITIGQLREKSDIVMH